MKKGEVYMRTGPALSLTGGVLRTGDIAITECRAESWFRVLVPRMGRSYEFPASYFNNKHFWEKVEITHDQTTDQQINTR